MILLRSFLKKVAIGGSITLASLITVKAMALLNSVIAARLLGPSDYGAFSVIANLQNFAVIIACTGVPLALAKYISQWRGVDESVARDIASALMRVLVISALVAGLVYFMIAEWIAVDVYDDANLTWPIRLSSLFVVASSLNVAFTSVAQGCLRISGLAKANAFVAIIAQPLTLTLILFFGLFGAILAQVCATAVSVLLLWSISSSTLRFSLVGFRRKAASFGNGIALSFALPAFLSSLLLVPAYWFGRTVLALNWGFDSVGEFQVAESLSQLMLVIPAAVSIPLLPLISEMHSREPHMVGSSSSSLLRASLFVVIPAVILSLPLLNFFIGLLYGTDYENASETTALMFASSTFVALSTVMSTVVIGMGRMWAGFAMNCVWAAFFFTLVLLIVPLQNSEGLATTYLVSYAAYFTILLAYFRRKLGMRLGWLPLPVSLFIMYLIAHVTVLSSQSIIIGITSACAAALAALIVTYRLVMTPEERAMIPSILRWISARLRIRTSR